MASEKEEPLNYQGFTCEDFTLSKEDIYSLTRNNSIEVPSNDKQLVPVLTERGYEVVKISKNLKRKVIYFNNYEPVELFVKGIKYKKYQPVVDIRVRNKENNRCFKTSKKIIGKFTTKKSALIIRNVIKDLPDDFGPIDTIHIDEPRYEVIDNTPVALILEKPSTCILCTAEIQLEDNTWLKIERLILGQRIKLHDGTIATIDAITKSSYQGNIYGCVTDYHPIEFNGKLEFACDVLEPTGYHNDDVYNIGGICDDDSRAMKMIIKNFDYPVACAFSNEASEDDPTYSKEWGTTTGTLYELVKKRGGFVNLDTWEFLRNEKGIATKIVPIF